MANTFGADVQAVEIAQVPQAHAQEALTNSPIFDLRGLRVDYVNGALQLSGCVETFYHKQLAQEVVRNVADGLPVVNRIAVEYA